MKNNNVTNNKKVPVPKFKKLISGTGTEMQAFTLVELIVVITILAIL
jgi:prepilin-type N-terminal cleavage/methylation domain-containing protein